MPIKVTVKHWHAAAAWTWNAGDDVCGICRMPFDGCPPGSKFPGDDSPVVWGTCGHAFHLQCISKWLQSDTDQVSVPSHREQLCRGTPPTSFWFETPEKFQTRNWSGASRLGLSHDSLHLQQLPRAPTHQGSSLNRSHMCDACMAQRCPICRAPWEFKLAGGDENNNAEGSRDNREVEMA